MYIGFHVKYPLFSLDLTKLELSRQISEKKSWNMQFHKNLSSGSRVVPYCGVGTRTDRHTGIRKLIQVRSKDSQVKTQLVLWIFILFKVTS